MTYSEFRTETADFLGWTRDSANWSSEESDRLDSILKSAYNQFIYSAVAPGETVAHRWSFLRPRKTLETVANQYLYDMPDDFNYIVGDMVFDADEDVHVIIQHTNPALIDRNRAVNDYQERPYQFALRPKSTDQTKDQITELMLYPTPDVAYSIVYYYDAKFRDLSETNPYPLGGQAHSETILQMCRDIAAARYKDQPAGPEHQLAMERLKASIEADRRDSPKTLGLNDEGDHLVYTRHGTEFSVSLTGNLGTG